MLTKFFKLDENNTNLKTEFLAGLTTFLAMAYILGVNPALLSEGGMPATGVFFATALASGISCIIMGLVSKYPVGLAPGMGIIPVFTYTIIISMGNTWETALAAVFVSSILFILITISGLREAILNAIPLDLKFAIGAGIGFFLAFVGLKGAGIIIGNSSTLVGMGNISSAPALLAIIGIMLTLVLYLKKVPAAVFLGLVITSILGVIFTLFGFGTGNALMPSIPTHFISFNFDVSLVGAFTKGFSQLFSNIPNLLTILFSLLFVTFFDTTGTLIPLANQCGFIYEEGNADGIDRAFLADAISGIIGAVFGTSTLNAYVESATGIGLGGRTGLTAIFIGIFFCLCPYSFIIIHFFSDSSGISDCRYTDGCTIERGRLEQHGYGIFRIHNYHNDDFNILHHNRYIMGIHHLCSCIHCYRRNKRIQTDYLAADYCIHGITIFGTLIC